MGNLLKFEFRKMKRLKSFYICLGLMLVSVLITAVTLNLIDMSSIEDQLSELDQASINLAKNGVDFMLSAVSNASYLTIVGVFVAIFVCSDFDEQTIKNVYAKGYTRQSVYFSKLIATLVLSTIMFVACLAFAFAVGTAFWGVGEGSVLKILAVVGVQYVACIANVMFFFAISILLSKMGISIALNIIAPIVISLVLALVDTIIKIKDFALSNYWMTTFITDTSFLSITTTRLLVCLAFSVIYIVALVVLGLNFARKKEI